MLVVDCSLLLFVARVLLVLRCWLLFVGCYLSVVCGCCG